MANISILIVDDHPLFRKGMRSLLESLPDFEVVGEAADRHAAIQLAGDIQPDVILMDLQMPGGSALKISSCTSGDVQFSRMVRTNRIETSSVGP